MAVNVTWNKETATVFDRVLTEMEAEEKIVTIERVVNGDEVHYLVECVSVYHTLELGMRFGSALNQKFGS